MTMQNEYFLNRQIRTALYGLKRQYGGAIVIFHLLSSEADPKTGEASVATRATRIRRAVILPAKITRDVERSISAISANKQMVMGGYHDNSKRLVIIERRDAPHLQLAKDDWLVYNGAKFAIESFEEYEFSAAWMVTVKHLLGEEASVATLMQSLSAEDTLDLQSDVEGEV